MVLVFSIRVYKIYKKGLEEKERKANEKDRSLNGNDHHSKRSKVENTQ